MSKQQINELKNLIEQLFLGSVSRGLDFQKAIPIGKLSMEGRNLLKRISNLDFKEDIQFCLHPSDLYHIYLNHFGSNEDDLSNLNPLHIDDIRTIAEVLFHPDAIVYLGEDKKGKKFAFFLENEAGSYNLIEVYAQKRAKLTVKTCYNRKKGVSQSAMTLLAQTSETYGATLVDANIPILFEYETDLVNKAQELLAQIKFEDEESDNLESK